MTCPKCGSQETRVTNSRQRNTERERRRECDACGHRFSTLEVWREEYRDLQAVVKPAHRDALRTMLRVAQELGRNHA